jgi:ubiquinone/menaquinone biosynthesis C-methylase UbiE
MRSRAFFDEFSKQYEDQNRYKYLWYRWTVDNIIKQIPRESGLILDLGTGNGEIAARAALKFPKSRVIGLDVSSGMTIEAEKKVNKLGLKNVRFLVSSMEDFKMERTDVVVSHLAFHHVRSKQPVITRIYRILPRKGKVIIGDWFKPTKKYEKQIEKLKAKNPLLSRKFDESWQDFLSEVRGDYQKEHPKEYVISQTKLRNMMKKAGFRKRRIIRMPLATFAVVVGEK